MSRFICKPIWVDFPVYSSLGSLDTREPRLFDGEYSRESRLPGVPSDEYIRESIINMNNSSYIRKKFKSFLGISKGTRRSCLMEKKQSKKSQDTVHLRSAIGCKDDELLSILSRAGPVQYFKTAVETVN
jgi:hypothetical protein